MSRECCGPTEPVSSPTTPDVAPAHHAPVGDDCCGPATLDAHAPLVREETVAWWRDRTLLAPAVCGILVVAGLVGGWSVLPHPAVRALEAGALVTGASTFAPAALTRLRRGRLGVGLLMTIAALGAVALGRVGEAAALAFLFSIAEALEERAMTRARHGLRALLSLIPETARVIRDRAEVDVPAGALRVGDVLVVGAGGRVSTDGVVVEGRSSVDASVVTGESIPVAAEIGTEVPAGAVNGSGTLHVRATADGRDNSLTRIVRLVEQAHARKGERARLADRIARPMVPAVLLLATAVAAAGLLFGDDPALWAERALVVLVAASPCAMALAVPVTVISAIGAASRLGVVVTSGRAFEQLGTIRTVAFDKTGTLTRNLPRVSSVAVQESQGSTRETILRCAAALESTSSHPLAAALRAAAPSAPTATEVEEHAGNGVAGRVDGHRVRVGSPRWIAPGPLRGKASAMAADGMSLVVVEIDDRVVGVAGVRDDLRPEAAEAVRMLRERGIEMLMLTGDNRLTAQALAREAGIDDVRAEQLPADKADAVHRAAAGGATAMIGDGINDAPALAAATVGIAIGATGSAAAVESADVAFTGSDLRQIPLALDHARRGRRIMTGNIALSLVIVIALVPLALLGILGLTEVVVVHELAEVLVILNGMRAARIPPSPRAQTVTAPSVGRPAASLTG